MKSRYLLFYMQSYRNILTKNDFFLVPRLWIKKRSTIYYKNRRAQSDLYKKYIFIRCMNQCFPCIFNLTSLTKLEILYRTFNCYKFGTFSINHRQNFAKYAYLKMIVYCWAYFISLEIKRLCFNIKLYVTY